MEIKFVRDVFGNGWYINPDHIVYAAKIEKPEEVSKVTGSNELKKCYVLHMTNGQTFVIENMI